MLSSTTNNMQTSIGDLQLASGAPAPITTDVKPKFSALLMSSSKSTTQRTCEQLDLWKAVELLEACFPAVSPAIAFAVEQLDPKAASGRWYNLVNLAARYV